jgi:hypothetical protein
VRVALLSMPQRGSRHKLQRAVAQLVEHTVETRGVAGANPARSAFALIAQWIEREPTKLKVGGSSPPGCLLGSRLTAGPWSLKPQIGVRIPAPQLAFVAQWIEHRFPKPGVIGSNPIGCITEGSSIGRAADR